MMQGEAQNKTNPIPTSRFLLAIGFFAMAALLGFGWRPFQAEYFPVRFVRIQGAIEHLDKQEFESGLRPLLGAGYWALDLDRVRQAVERIQWVAALQIQRLWPDTLVLRIMEHVPVARFGEDRLLSAQGIVFLPQGIEEFRDLPLIEGPQDRSAELFAAFLKINEAAEDSGLSVAKLQVSERNSWSLEMDDGLIVELGREAPLKNFQQFSDTLSLLGDELIRAMVRVDLRYRNGYAVEWKAGTEPEWSSFVKGSDPRQRERVERI
ncbi:MAG: cell division protein FtsQ/DivIB [Gammaproteobacteria bacterium]